MGKLKGKHAFLTILSITGVIDSNMVLADEVLDTISVQSDLSGDIQRHHLLNTEQQIDTSNIKRNQTLGNLLKDTVGVQTNYFGPSSSRPVIRGMGGQRVAILENGVPLSDLSVISGNLATPIDMNNIENITILRSGANVLYGGRSIGGAVDITNYSIPSTVLNKLAQGEISVNKGINSPDQFSFKVNTKINEQWLWYFSGSYTHINQIKVPHQAKDGICYDQEYLQGKTDLQRYCQVDVPLLSSINPAYFKYISQFYLDNYKDPSYGLTEGDKYTNNIGYWKPNPVNPDYVAGSPYYINKYGKLTEYKSYLGNTIPNSGMRTRTFTVGSSYIDTFGYSGIAINYFDSFYGVPGFAYIRSKTSNTPTFEDVFVANNTYKINWKTHLVRPYRYIEDMDINFSYQKSKDKELVGDTPSNIFNTDTYASRFTINHERLFDRIIGTWGVDLEHKKLVTQGADSYLPSLNRYQYGLFGIEKVDFYPFFLEIGHRIGKVKYVLKEKNQSAVGSSSAYYSKDRHFYLQNTHLALQFEPISNAYIRVQRTFSERAPDINELYSNNNHYALLIEEQGDARLDKEKSHSWEISGGLDYDDLNLNLTWFENKYSNFTYLSYSGLTRNNLIVKYWRQVPLNLKGIELSAKYRVDLGNLGVWNVSGFWDKIQHQLPNKLIGLGNHLPNLPTSRVGGKIDVEYGKTKFFVSVTHYLKQKDISNEIDEKLIIPSFTLVDLGLNYTYPINGNEIEWYLDVKNLTNREARLNTSSLRFLTPLPGRSINLGVKFKF